MTSTATLRIDGRAAKGLAARERLLCGKKHHRTARPGARALGAEPVRQRKLALIEGDASEAAGFGRLSWWWARAADPETSALGPRRLQDQWVVAGRHARHRHSAVAVPAGNGGGAAC